MNVHAESSDVTLFWYYPAVIISSAYPDFFPSGNDVCFVLVEAPVLADYFLVFYIDAWVSRPITLVVVFTRCSFMVLSRIFIIDVILLVYFLPRLALPDLV